MSLFASYTFTTVEQVIADLADFAADNGWTIDYESTTRLHLHKGDNHFEITKGTTTRIYMYGCSGYDSGAAASAQPGTSNTAYLGDINGGTYRFASSGNTLYFYCEYSSVGYWRGFGEITEKVGSWSGGQILIGGVNNERSFYTESYANRQIAYIDGEWTPNSSTTVAGGFFGLLTTNHGLYVAPSRYNYGMVPAKVPLFVRNTTTNTLLHPIGFAPGIYICNPGDVYDLYDIITISGGSYLVAKTNIYFLIKLEA